LRLESKGGGHISSRAGRRETGSSGRLEGSRRAQALEVGDRGAVTCCQRRGDALNGTCGDARRDGGGSSTG